MLAIISIPYRGGNYIGEYIGLFLGVWTIAHVKLSAYFSQGFGPSRCKEIEFDGGL